MKRFLIGQWARALNCIPVIRAQDRARIGSGTVSVTGTKMKGKNTKFSSELDVGESIKISGISTTPAVKSIISDSELELKFPFDHEGAITDHKFKIYPKLDQHEVYEQVFERLHEGGAIGIFPEGGSHDNPHLIALKGGVRLFFFSFFFLLFFNLFVS
jgi:glycerol-3-phosphate O-acyltransferase/dihydroxyacetone phosphate acyltransferase